MIRSSSPTPPSLYEQDETAWLEEMAALAAEGRWSEMDHHHLGEYLADMAKRDRREVFSRLVVLLTHLLTWDLQPERRGGSRRGTIREQRRELKSLLESATLRQHAETVLSAACQEARLQAADETGLSPHPVETCPWALDAVLDDPLD